MWLALTSQGQFRCKAHCFNAWNADAEATKVNGNRVDEQYRHERKWENQEWRYSLVSLEWIDDGQSAINDLAMMQVFGIEYFDPGLKGCGHYQAVPA